MAMDFDMSTSVWVSGLTPPITRDLCKLFSRCGSIELLLVPDADVGECYIEFDTYDAAQEALSYDGRVFHSDIIHVTLPTLSQMEYLDASDNTVDVLSNGGERTSGLETMKESLSKLNPDEMLNALSDLTDWAKLKLQDSPAAHKTESGPAVKSISEPEVKKVVSEVRTIPTTVPETRVRQTPAVPSSLFNPFGNPYNLASPSDIRHSTQMNPTSPELNVLYNPYVPCPKVAFFSGDEGKDAPYLQWRNEVRCLLLEGHNPLAILQGIRRSLKGTAANILLTMGEGVSPIQIIEKFDVVFGVALTSEVLLEDFYTAKQKEGEKAVIWGCRLEQMLSQLRNRGFVQPNEDQMLRSKFWGGLTNVHLKNALRHRFDSGQNFQQLLLAARIIEHEAVENTTDVLSTDVKVLGSGKSTKAQAQVKSQQSVSHDSKLDDILRKMERLGDRIKGLEEQRKSLPKTTEARACFYCKKDGHLIRDCLKLQRKKTKETEDKQTQSSNSENSN